MPTKDKEPSGRAMELTPQEQKLILLLRELDYGDVSITVKDGKPVRLEEVRKSVVL